jgi:hypothetical protein
MNFQKIVKKTVDDSSEKRTVYFWEDGTELLPGLYNVRIPKWKNFRWYSAPLEMFICKNQERGEVVHDMYVSKYIEPLDLDEVYDHKSHKFLLERFMNEKEALLELQKRMKKK